MYHVTIISIVLPGWVLYDHITDHIKQKHGSHPLSAGSATNLTPTTYVSTDWIVRSRPQVPLRQRRLPSVVEERHG